MDYRTLVQHICTFTAQPALFTTLVEYASRDGHDSRKLVILLARFGRLPLLLSDMGKRLEPLLDHLAAKYTASVEWELRRYGYNKDITLLADHLSDLLSEPLSRGLIIHLSMITPISEEDVDEMTYRAFMRELDIATSGRMARELNLHSILSHSDFNTPIHHSVPANPKGAFLVRTAIESWNSSVVSGPIATVTCSSTNS
jgi:hypothetical protein